MQILQFRITYCFYLSLLSHQQFYSFSSNSFSTNFFSISHPHWGLILTNPERLLTTSKCSSLQKWWGRILIFEHSALRRYFHYTKVTSLPFLSYIIIFHFLNIRMSVVHRMNTSVYACWCSYSSLFSLWFDFFPFVNSPEKKLFRLFWWCSTDKSLKRVQPVSKDVCIVATPSSKLQLTMTDCDKKSKFSIISSFEIILNFSLKT